MKRTTLLQVLLWLLCIASYSQSPQSNQLFAEGVELYQQGRYTEAVTLFAQCDSLDRVALQTLSTSVEEEFRRLVMSVYIRRCEMQARYDDIATFLKRAIGFYRQTDNIQRVRGLNGQLMVLYTDYLKDYNRAEQVGKELLSMAQGADGLEIGSRMLLQKVYMTSGQRDKTIEQLQQIVALTKGNPTYRNNYIHSLIELAGCYTDQRKLSITQQVMDEFAAHPPHTPLDTMNYINAMAMYASALSDIGQTQKAYDWMEKRALMQKEHDGATSVNYVCAMSRLMLMEFQLKGIQHGPELIDKYLFLDTLIAGLIGRGELNLERLAGQTLHPIGIYEDISKYLLFMEMLCVHQRVVRQDSNSYFRSQSFEPFCRMVAGHYGYEHPVCKHLVMTFWLSEIAQGRFAKALELLNSIGEATDPTYDAYRSMCYIGLKNSQQAFTCAQRYYKKVVNDVMTNFKWMTSAERESYWMKATSQMVDFSGFVTDSTNQQLPMLLYNLKLLSKGLLLNTSMELHKVIEEKGDTAILNLYRRWQQTMQAMDRLSQSVSDYDSLRLAAMRVEADSLERQLTLQSQEFGDFTGDLSVSYQDVQKGLGPHDVAIEFSTYKDTDRRVRYYALVLDCAGTIRFVPLCDEQTLQEAAQCGYEHQRLYDAVWKPLQCYLSPKGRISFSADGLLHQIAIEHTAGTEDYHIYRLSSTRMLAAKAVQAGRGAVLYGGIDYSADAENQLDNDRHDNAALEPAQRGAVAEIDYLPGTKMEVEAIRQMIESVCPTRTVTGAEATEGSFKSLSGSRPLLLHIATHGFSKAKPQQSLSLPTAWNGMATLEDESLERTGILMAGASASLLNEWDVSGHEDGVLTAREISQLDLRGVHLVALSACETALGDITGEGVFGLQRGFKKAGAQSILMSLWKVDDEATCLLMTEFYRHWIGDGKTKHDALELAKQTVRSHKEKGWDDPKYWAAFILLDGLD